MEITTKRLLLRPISIDDAEDTFEYARNPNVGPNAGWKPHESLEETLVIMEEVFLNKEDVWGIILLENGKMIGSIGLIDEPKRRNSHTRMIGYALGHEYWGQGYMTEVVESVLDYGFGELGLDLISAYCYDFNDRSQGVLLDNGFVYEGELRLAEETYDGLIYDEKCYSITKEEYYKKRIGEV